MGFSIWNLRHDLAAERGKRGLGLQVEGLRSRVWGLGRDHWWQSEVGGLRVEG